MSLDFLCRTILATVVFVLILITSVQAQQFGMIQGNVVDDSTLIPLSNANIMLESTKRGTTSNASGRFVLHNVPPGAYSLKIGYIGYEVVRHSVRVLVGETVRMEIRLRRVMLQMPEIGVTATRQSYEEQSSRTQPSVISVSAQQVRRVPTVGEPDLFRALQTLPGFTSPSQVSNQLYVRGGSPDQNLVRIDGATIYNPFHLFGLAANVNPDLVGKVTVSTGGFPARYGDRLSGVIDVETRNVDEPFVATGNVSLLSSKILLGGRQRSRLQWLISGRRSYHDWAAKLFGETLPYHFYDLFAKTTFVAGRRDLLSFSLFYSADILYDTQTNSHEVYELDDQFRFVEPPNKIGFVYSHERFTFPWNNLAGNLRWEHTLSPKWSSSFAMSLSRTHNTGLEDETNTASPGLPQRYFDLYRTDNVGTDWSVSNTLGDLTLAANVLWQPNMAWRILGGVEFSRVDFEYDWQGFDAGEDGDIIFFFDQAPDSFAYRSEYSRSSFFLEGLWQLTPRLRLQPSLRADWRSSSTSYVLDPRLSATFEFDGSLRLQAALGRYHQGMAFLREQGLFGVNELYFPLSFTSAATHGILGMEYEPDPTTNVRIEAYYKHFDRQAVSVSADPLIRPAGGWAYGLETTARRGNWQAFYVFSRVRRSFDGLTYDTTWDVRHRLHLAGQFDLGKSWDFDFQWELRTGQPFSPKDLRQSVPRIGYDPRTGQPKYYDSDHEVGGNATFRFPIYHRLDVTFAKRLTTGKWSMAPYFQVINLYGRKNPLFFEDGYRYYTVASRALTTPYLKPVGVPPLPSLGVRFSF